MSASEEKHTNRLAGESSPYLLQHAHNPVDWYPWGDEAFERARADDKPIFLSVGYSACHWCHVMERESFEDEDVAKLLSEHFVSIKVDREERPDVDAIYMTSVQMLTGQGGWPMSVFLTPELKPFYGGTYFPKDSMYGRPGFIDVLQHLAKAYADDRERVFGAAQEITEKLTGADLGPLGDDAPGREELDVFFRSAVDGHDSTFGGFGMAPKFPHAMDLSLLLRYWKRTGEQLALNMVVLTLRKMAEGGMYDQIGGGFHRYSVDRQWLVPHFEKMLYDNGLLARTYFEGYQATGEPYFLRIGREILDYVQTEMTAPEGGFYSATDADSEGEEGKFFVWTPDEVEAVLGVDDARLFCLHYEITVGGNFENQQSIANVSRPLEQIAASHSMELAELEKRIADGREKLYDVREERVKPLRDEKILASWNGLMLSAFARGYQVTHDERYLETAKRAAAFLEECLIVDGVLLRTWKGGRAKIAGFLDDYAYLAEAFLDLYEASFDSAYLDRAKWLVERAVEEFGDDSGAGFFYSSARHTHLIHRRKDFLDNATPAANWVLALTLVRLAALTGDATFRDRAAAVYRGLETLVGRAPMGLATALMGADFALGPVLEVAVLGPLESPSTVDMLARLHRRFLPTRVIAAAPGPVDGDVAAKVPLLEGKDLVDGKTTVYLCENFTCKQPITDVAELERNLEKR